MDDKLESVGFFDDFIGSSKRSIGWLDKSVGPGVEV
jgi:hypothetical protein